MAGNGEDKSLMSGLNTKLTIFIAIFTVAGMIGSVAVTYNKVGELLDAVEILDAGQTESHDDIDILKIRIVQELYDGKIEALNKSHELELQIRDEKIDRLESVIEFYKIYN